MIIEFKIEAQDLLDFHLFTASKSERINRKKRNGWIALTLGSMVIAMYFYMNTNHPMAIYFGGVGIATGLFYPRYFTWRYKSHYKTHINENFSKRFGQTEKMEIHPDFISFSNKTGEGTVNLSEIEKTDETASHFFLKISTGGSIIIPKNQLDNCEALREKFRKAGLIVNDETHWKW